MKRIATILCLTAATSLLSGCVSRTVTREPQHRGATPTTKKKKKFGSDPHSELIEKKTVWFWQKDFRNP